MSKPIRPSLSVSQRIGHHGGVKHFSLTMLSLWRVCFHQRQVRSNKRQFFVTYICRIAFSCVYSFSLAPSSLKVPNTLYTGSGTLLPIET
jgi:hypothetical protein